MPAVQKGGACASSATGVGTGEDGYCAGGAGGGEHRKVKVDKRPVRGGDDSRCCGRGSKVSDLNNTVDDSFDLLKQHTGLCNALRAGLGRALAESKFHARIAEVAGGALAAEDVRCKWWRDCIRRAGAARCHGLHNLRGGDVADKQVRIGIFGLGQGVGARGTRDALDRYELPENAPAGASVGCVRDEIDSNHSSCHLDYVRWVVDVEIGKGSGP